MKRTKSDAHAQFIERMGIAADHDGLSRIAGRLFGALLLSDRPCSLDELAERLGASKASISIDARRLHERGIVERSARPGDRRDYYAMAPDFFDRIIRHRLTRWAGLRQLVGELRQSASEQSPLVRARFAYIDEFESFVLGRVDEALREWEVRRTAKARPRRPTGRRTRTGSAA